MTPLERELRPRHQSIQRFGQRRDGAPTARLGSELDEKRLGTEDYVHWERKVPVKPDGSMGYA